MGALPKALARRGHRVMVVVPRYSNYEEGWDTSVRRSFKVMGSDTEASTFPYATATKHSPLFKGMHMHEHCISNQEALNTEARIAHVTE